MSHLAGIWDDIIIYNTALATGAGSPALTTIAGNIKAWSLATGDGLYGSFELPHGYKEGTDLNVHIHWAPTNTNTGDCVLDFEYLVAGVGAVLTGATISKTQAGSGTINQHQLAEISTVISGAGRKIGDIVAFHFSRNSVGDTFTGRALILSVGIHYEKDSAGSNTKTTKN